MSVYPCLVALLALFLLELGCVNASHQWGVEVLASSTGIPTAFVNSTGRVVRTALSGHSVGHILIPGVNFTLVMFVVDSDGFILQGVNRHLQQADIKPSMIPTAGWSTGILTTTPSITAPTFDEKTSLWLSTLSIPVSTTSELIRLTAKSADAGGLSIHLAATTINPSSVHLSFSSLFQFSNQTVVSNIGTKLAGQPPPGDARPIDFDCQRDGSALCIGIVNATGLQVVLADSQLQSQTTYTLNISSVFDSSQTTCPDPNVASPVVVADRILLASRAGVVETLQSGALAWTASLTHCTAYLSSTKDTSGTDVVYAATSAPSPSVYLSREPNSWTEFVDTTSRNLSAFLAGHADASNVTVHSIDRSLIDTRSTVILTSWSQQSTQVTAIIRYDSARSSLFNGGTQSPAVGGEWSVLYVFPTTVAVSSKLIFNGTSEGSFTLTLSGLRFANRQNQDMYVWGNAILYSPDAGTSFFVLHTLSSGSIVSVASASNGLICFLTSSGSILANHVGEADVHSLDLSTASMSIYALHFSPRNELLLLSRRNHTTPLLVVSGTAFLAESLRAHSGTTVCPYTDITFEVPSDAIVLRSTATPSQHTLPGTTYLDYGSTFALSMTLFFLTQEHLAQARISARVQSSGTKAITLHETYSPDVSSLTMKYTLTITDDRMVKPLSPPGVNLTTSAIQLEVVDANAACNAAVSESSEGATVLPSHTFGMTVKTGCPPSRVLQFDAIRSRNKFEACSIEDGIPCFSFVYEFEPKFVIKDLVTGALNDYNGILEFNVIAGGRSPDSLRRYSEEEMDDFNEGQRSIWATDSTERRISPRDTGVTWVCAVGSPCAQVTPNFWSTPDYYFLVRATTVGVTDAAYCDYTLDVVMRVHGLNLDYLTLISICTVAISAMILVTFSSFLCCKAAYEEAHEELQDLIADAKEEEEED